MANNFMSIELHLVEYKDHEKFIHKQITLFTDAGSVILTDECIGGADVNKEDFDTTVLTYKKSIGDPKIDIYETNKGFVSTRHYLVWFVHLQ